MRMKRNMKEMLSAFLLAAGAVYGYGENPVLYRLYDNTGKEIEFSAMIDSLKKSDVVFVGESHNCPVSHWMEFKIAEALYKEHGDKLVIGEEMMEADNQLILDEYMNRKISYDRFESEARLWPNYSTDYYPVVFFAKDNGIRFVATNVPRRYANAVSNEGLECLNSFSDEAKSYIAPLPISFKYDSDEASSKFGAMQMLRRKSPEEMQRLAEAQAIKDATMGWFISKNLPSDGHFLHINGTMHSDGRDGIIPYLEEYRPGTRIATVTSLRADDASTLEQEYLGTADFYIVVSTDFPTSY